MLERVSWLLDRATAPELSNMSNEEGKIEGRRLIEVETSAGFGPQTRTVQIVRVEIEDGRLGERLREEIAETRFACPCPARKSDRHH
jgi:hypothetical protein